MLRISVDSGFWGNKTELVRKEVIPYQYKAITDAVPGAVKSYSMRNFRVAAAIAARLRVDPSYRPPEYGVESFEIWPEDEEAPEDRFYGFAFQDTDVYKWIEAAAYTLENHPDAELLEKIDQAVALIGSAQLPDGYLDTYYIINALSKRFTDLCVRHELYCLGHLTEAAVALARVTGHEDLLHIAEAYADCVGRRIGPDEGQIPGYPGHEIAEMALAALYEYTGKEKYKDLGAYFIRERGRRPSFFAKEQAALGVSRNQGSRNYAPDPKRTGPMNMPYSYNQAHEPVCDQTEAVGHAVRAVYLYSGMADFARLLGDEDLDRAVCRLWESITRRKMYLTGGIGATHLGEAFSFDYDLPADTAYNETCAAVGLVFFASRMTRLHKKREYADIAERVLYNAMLSGISLDGKSFFYVNPLEVYPYASHHDDRKAHVLPTRAAWLGCACCPPNLARLVSSIGKYSIEEEGDFLYIHQYIGCQAQGGGLDFTMVSGFPYRGDVSLHMNADSDRSLALRLPAWSEQVRLTVQGQSLELDGDLDQDRRLDDKTYLEGGYLYLNRLWKAGDEVRIQFSMQARFVQADLKVRECIGKVALVRGPLVYCLEEADNGPDLHRLLLDPQVPVREEDGQVVGEPVLVLHGSGWRICQDSSKTKGVGGLYGIFRPAHREAADLTFIPYYAWANRGEGEMQVFCRI